MGKAILVLDEMPKKCGECHFCAKDTFRGETIYFCTAKEVLKPVEKDYCPLMPMPKKKPELFPQKTVNFEVVSVKDNPYGKGWNDCLRTIGGYDD